MVILPEPTLSNGSARLEVWNAVFRWFDECDVKLCVIGIFVIVDAITVDKLADW